MTLAERAIPPDVVALLTERADPRLADLDTLSVGELFALMNRAEAEVPAAVRAAGPAVVAALEAAAARVDAGGRMLYVGAGTPGRLAVLDAAECPPTFSTPPELVQAILAGGPAAMVDAVEGAEDDESAGHTAVARAVVGPADVVVGLSASGRTPFVIGAVREAGRRGAVTIGVSCNPGAVLSAAVDHPIEVLVGPEVLAGSTRLKAGSAQKQLLNMFSTIAMIRSGRTYGNLMVDLRATNGKLRARARHIVEQVAGVPAASADRALDAAGLSAPVAIVMLRRGVDVATATAMLRAARGRLRQALDG